MHTRSKRALIMRIALRDAVCRTSCAGSYVARPLLPFQVRTLLDCFVRRRGRDDPPGDGVRSPHGPLFCPLVWFWRT